MTSVRRTTTRRMIKERSGRQFGPSRKDNRTRTARRCGSRIGAVGSAPWFGTPPASRHDSISVSVSQSYLCASLGGALCQPAAESL